MSIFQVGDVVRWSSSAQGYTKEKTGTVVEVVQPGKRPNRLRFASLYKMGIGSTRTSVSYVVHVETGVNKAGNKGRYYWPHASKLGRPLQPLSE